MPETSDVSPKRPWFQTLLGGPGRLDPECLAFGGCLFLTHQAVGGLDGACSFFFLRLGFQVLAWPNSGPSAHES